MTCAKDAADIRVEFLLLYILLNLPVDQWGPGSWQPHCLASSVCTTR